MFIPNLSKKLIKSYFRARWRLFSSKSIKQPYNVLFLGSDKIALNCLVKINELRKTENVIKRLDLVIANKSKSISTIDQYAQTEGIQTIPWPIEDLRHGQYDVGLISAFGHLIKDDVLDKFPLGMINMHPSLLPRWRGAAPIIHTLLNGDKVTGISLMKIKPNVFDVGEIIMQRKLEVPDNMCLPELTDIIARIAPEMLVECVRTLPQCLENARPQSQEGVTYGKWVDPGKNLLRGRSCVRTASNIINVKVSKKISKDISVVRWTEMTAKDVYNLYRAIYGLHSLVTKCMNKELKLFDSFLVDNDEIDYNKPIGTLEYSYKHNAIRVLCKDRRYVYFKSVRIVGKRRISAYDFNNGYIKMVTIDTRQPMVCLNK